MRLRPRHPIAVASLLLGASLGDGAGGSVDVPEGRRPHVVVLVMDTTRGDRCGFNGHPVDTTPRLDEFARDAVVFRDAWSPAPWTLPAHVTLFTGLRPERHGVNSDTRLHLDPEATTLAEILGGAGWRTGCFTNNEFLSESFGTVQGFEVVEPHYAWEGRPYPWAPATHDRALRWAADVDARGESFLLVVNDMEAHLPYTAPDPHLTRHLPADANAAEREATRTFGAPRTLEINFGGLRPTEREWALLSGAYDAEIATLDAAVGDLLDGLRAEGLLDRSIVVVLGDHGENLGEHGLCQHVTSLGRAVRHVPLLVRYPALGFRGGRRVDGVARVEDVLPTILDLAGLPIPEDLDGETLTRDLTGRVAPGILAPHSAGFVARFREDFPSLDPTPYTVGRRAVYDGRFHLVLSTDGSVELYDVRADPFERVNLAPRGGPDLMRLRALLEPDRPPL